MIGGLGRVSPPDDAHIRAYPLRLSGARPDVCERNLPLGSWWRGYYNQHDTPRCVGYSASQERSLSERVTFDPNWLYEQSKLRDGIPHEDGTYLRVAYDVLREQGHVRFRSHDPNPTFGVERNEWARSIDDIRHAIASGMAVVAGTNWYERMFVPEQRRGVSWLPPGDAHLGRIAGGHAYLLNRVSDQREAFGTPNSWGRADRRWSPGEDGWPVTMVPYSLMERLIREDGEAVLVVDRVQS